MTRDELIEKMLDADSQSCKSSESWRSYCVEDRMTFRLGMSAALDVVLDICLSEPTDDEMIATARIGVNWAFGKGLDYDRVRDIFASRRATLALSKTLEDRVGVEEVHTTPLNYSPNCAFTVMLDGKPTGPLHSKREYAQIYRLGLIQQLKSDSHIKDDYQQVTGG